MKIAIKSHGNSHNTYVSDKISGKIIDGVRKATWEMDASGDGIGHAVLTFDLVDLEFEAEAEKHLMCFADPALLDGAVVVNEHGDRIGIIVLDKKGNEK